MSWDNLNTEIKTELDTLNNVGKVYDYPEAVTNINSKNWPVAVIVPSSADGEFLNTDENLTTYAFDVYFINLAKNKPNDTAYQELRDAVDEAVNHFNLEANFDLNGAAEWTEALPSRWFTDQTSGGNLVVFATVVIQSKVRSQT